MGYESNKITEIKLFTVKYKWYHRLYNETILKLINSFRKNKLEKWSIEEDIGYISNEKFYL